MTLDEPSRKAAMRCIIWTQCFGVTAESTVLNGTLLLYLTAMGADAGRTMAYLAIFPLTSAVLLLPAAYLADRHGKTRVGQTGIAIGVAGWGLLAFAPSAAASVEFVAVAGIVLAAICGSAIIAGWFSLLTPIVPIEIRGRFFGRLRTILSLVTIGLSILYAIILSANNHVSVYQGIYLLATIAFVARFFTYGRIPELEPPTARQDTFFKTVIEVTRQKNLARFCNYTFLLLLSTAGAATLFAMTEKRVLGFSDSQVLVLSNISVAGSIAGLILGGRTVDRHGPRFVFAGCHLALAAGLFAFPMRVLFPEAAVLAYLGTLHFLLGATRGAMGIAMTTELMGIIPMKNRAVAASTFSVFQTLGISISGFIPACILKMGILADDWSFAGRSLSSFDAILLGYAAMTLLLVATLGLVPSMKRKSEAVSLGMNRI